jgi:partner of Y14 and mago protein
MAPTAETTRSGIRKLSTGESVIPASTRPDGSVRKEIRVKPGYKPPEDVEVYRNRTAQAWKNRGKGGVVGAEPVEDKSPLQAAAAAAKNAKRREARKKAAATGGDGKSGEDEGAANGTTGVEVKEPVDPEAEKAKEARKLAKKLRQARELSEKKEKGEGLLPEQFQKVIKIQELIRQLDNLGFDTEGEKKAAETNAG